MKTYSFFTEEIWAWLGSFHVEAPTKHTLETVGDNRTATMASVLLDVYSEYRVARWNGKCPVLDLLQDITKSHLIDSHINHAIHWTMTFICSSIFSVSRTLTPFPFQIPFITIPGPDLSLLYFSIIWQAPWGLQRESRCSSLSKKICSPVVVVQTDIFSALESGGRGIQGQLQSSSEL